MYQGPIIDSFLHGPWIGRFDPAAPRADVVPWVDDPRLRRVMHTFSHPSGSGDAVAQVTLPDLLGTMEDAGVAGGILAAKVYYPTTADRLDTLHRELSSLCGNAAGRLKWLATVVPPAHGPGTYWDVMQGPRTLDALREEPGLVGVHITPSPWGLPPNDRWYYPLYARCVDLGLKLFTYVGMPGPLWPMHPNDPAHLDDVALAFPDLVIIAHHIGDPWNDMAVRLAARHENFFICTSAWAPKAYPKALVDFMAGGWHGTKGCDKVLFASDHPLLDMKRATESARRLGLSGAALERVMYGNARELFFK